MGGAEALTRSPSSLPGATRSSETLGNEELVEAHGMSRLVKRIESNWIERFIAERALLEGDVVSLSFRRSCG